MIVLLLPVMAQVSVSAPVQIQRVPDVQAPTVQMVQPSANLQARLLPDLVAREIRKDGPNAVRVLVANEGTADDTRAFTVVASASYRSRRGYAMNMSAGPLKVGESQWVRFGSFHPDGESWYPGKPEPTLADWETIAVTVDVHIAASGWGSGMPSLDPTPNPCTAERGCVIELDEKNNYLSVPIASMADWTGD